MSLKHNNKGFSLLELVIFIALFSTIFFTITYASIISIKTNKINEHKIMASYYTESLIEWLRGEKDASWSGFLKESQLDNNNSVTYCFNDYNMQWQHELSSPPSPTPFIFQNQCGDNYKLNNLFSRQLELSKITGPVNETQIEANVVIRWYEGDILYPLNTKTILNQYE